jgi:hypothetical protein
MSLTDPKEWDEIRVTVDGKTVKLEDAFEVFEDLFDDAEEAFKHIEEAFAHVDADIHDKVNDLRKVIAKSRPDEFEYIPDRGEHWFGISKRKNTIHRAIIGMLIFLLLVFSGLFYMAVTLESKPAEFGAPSTNESTTTYEELEKL